MTENIYDRKSPKVKTRTTLKEVAAAAGVSQTTACLYLNGSSHVCSDETAARIRQAITQLQYTRGLRALDAASAKNSVPTLPKSREDSAKDTAYLREKMPTRPGNKIDGVAEIGRTPVSTRRQKREAPDRPSLALARRLRTIGVSLPTAFSSDGTELSHPAMAQFANQIWAGASEYAEWEECRLLTFPRRLRSLPSAEAFMEGSIGGLIMEAGFHDPRLESLMRFGLPVVLVNRFLDIPKGCGAVYPMERDTVEVALQYLWARGHRRIAFYGGPVIAMDSPQTGATPVTTGIDWEPSDIATMRFERYRVFMRSRQQESASITFCEKNWDGDHASDALAQWEQSPQPPTAVLCASDSLALALWDVAEQKGLFIPEDLSIVGIGDIPEAHRAGRPLTSVALPGVEVGREAMRLLMRIIEGVPAEQCRQAIPLDASSLIERSSVVCRENFAG